MRNIRYLGDLKSDDFSVGWDEFFKGFWGMKKTDLLRVLD
jgi:hypothetical protein